MAGTLAQQANLTARSSAVVIWQVPSKLSLDTAHSISWWRRCMTLAMARCATRKVIIMSDHRHPPHIPSATLGKPYEGAVRIFSITSGLGATSHTSPHFPHFRFSVSSLKAFTASFIWVPRLVQWKLASWTLSPQF